MVLPTPPDKTQEPNPSRKQENSESQDPTLLWFPDGPSFYTNPSGTKKRPTNEGTTESSLFSSVFVLFRVPLFFPRGARKGGRSRTEDKETGCLLPRVTQTRPSSECARRPQCTGPVHVGRGKDGVVERVFVGPTTPPPPPLYTFAPPPRAPGRARFPSASES